MSDYLELQSQNYSAGSHPITINVENAKLEDVLDDIVSQMKNYKWEINDGVINIYPKEGRDPTFEKLLKLKIKNFKFEAGRKIMDIGEDQIPSLPEIKEFLAENNLLSMSHSDVHGSGLFLNWTKK